jgi:hypothetical protein
MPEIDLKETLRQLGIKASALEKVTHKDVDYLCNYVFPFIQIINPEVGMRSETGELIEETPSEVRLSFKPLPNGWIIFDYDIAMSAAAPQPPKEDGGEGGEGGGSGTIIKQQFDTVMAMITEARTKGWASIAVIAGTELMKLYASIAAEILGIALVGFEPTEAQKKRFSFLKEEADKHIYGPRAKL